MDIKNNILIKKSPFKRILQHIDFSVSFSWDNLFIAIIGSFLLYLLAIGTGIIDLNVNLYLFGIIGEISKSISLYIKRFFILEVFIILFLIRKIPLKIMKKQVIIFAIFLSLAFLSTFLCRINTFLFIIISLIWIIIFIYTQQNENLNTIGSFTVISYIFYLSIIIPLNNCSLGFIVKSTIIIFISVFIASIPMFCIRLLQHDPYKKELFINLFKKQNSYYELYKTKKSILKFDQSNYTKSIINIAEELFASNINLNTLSLNLDHKEKIDQLKAEIDRLIKKITFAIENSLEDWFEINISKITEFHKDIDYEIKSENNNLNQSFLNYMVKKYKNTFEKLNDIFAKKSLPDFTVNLKEINIINEKLKTDTLEYRYSIRFVIVLLICFIWDYVNKNWMFTATLLSFFTLTTNLIFNSEVFLIRVYATIMSVLIGLGILIICSILNITFIIFPLSTLAFLLFFLFKDNGYRACFLFLLGFILWAPQGTVNTTILFTVNGILSLTVIILIFNLIMPKKSKTNIIELLISKIDLTKKSINEFYNEGFEEDTLEKLSENNIEINNILKKLNNKYENINNEIELFNNLSHTLDDYGNKINSIKLILDEEKINYDYNTILKESEIMLDSFKNILENKNIDNNFNSISYNFKKDLDSEDTIKFIYPILMSLILNVNEINNTLTKIKQESLIEKYNKNLIKNIFNVKDIYANN